MTTPAVGRAPRITAADRATIRQALYDAIDWQASILETHEARYEASVIAGAHCTPGSRLDLLELRPHLTGPLSMLDEATLAFGWKYPEVAAEQRAFAAARSAHMSSCRETGEYSDEAWREAMTAAHALADALRPLGDIRIARCKQPAGWGTCDLPLDDDGVCHGRDHITAGPSGNSQ